MSGKLEFKRRKLGRGVDEWHRTCMEKFGWSCTIDGREYQILANGILALVEPYVPGAHRKCIMFRDWCKKALGGGEEWKLIAWQESLKPSVEDAGTDNAVKSTSDSSSEPSGISDWTQTNLESTLAEVADPGMCASLLKVFATPSNASEDAPRVSSEQSPVISRKETSVGTACGSTIEDLLPF